MKIEEYYNENYPDAKPWNLLTKAEKKAIKRKRRKENWANIKDTIEDVFDVVDFIRMILSRGK